MCCVCAADHTLICNRLLPLVMHILTILLTSHGPDEVTCHEIMCKLYYGTVC